MPFEEAEVLEKNKPFIFENMKTIKTIRFMDKNEEELAAIDGAKQVSESAVPGKPAIMFFWARYRKSSRDFESHKKAWSNHQE